MLHALTNIGIPRQTMQRVDFYFMRKEITYSSITAKSSTTISTPLTLCYKDSIATKQKANKATRRNSIVNAASKGFGSTSTQNKTKKSSCPCGSGKSYSNCCKKYHTGEKLPDTAEELMRSRYTAYAKGLVDYVVQTTHPDNSAAKEDIKTLRDDVRATCDKITWDKLVILGNESGNDDEAFVTFKTYFKVVGQQGQRAQGFHTQSFIERSRFLRRPSDGAWLYVDGEQDWQQ